MLLLDAARFPRDKVCGEGVSPEAWRLLDRHRRERAPCARSGPAPARACGSSPARHEFRGRYRGRDAAGFAAAARSALDAALLACGPRGRRRGAARARGSRACCASERRACVGVAVVAGRDDERRSQRPWARVVVGADGRRSVVARRLGLLREHPTLRRFAVRGYWDGMEGLEPFGEMHVAERGYCGMAPLSARLANVAFVLDAGEMRPPAAISRASTGATLAERWPALAERLAGRGCASRRGRSARSPSSAAGVAAPAPLLVGDAAGFYDPFTGEGITLALRTAELAAAAIAHGLRARPGAAAATALSGYERERDRATRDKFRFNRLLQLAGQPARGRGRTRWRDAPRPPARPGRSPGRHRRRLRAGSRGLRPALPAGAAAGVKRSPRCAADAGLR